MKSDTSSFLIHKRASFKGTLTNDFSIFVRKLFRLYLLLWISKNNNCIQDQRQR